MSPGVIRRAEVGEYELLKAMLDKANGYSLTKSTVTQWTRMERVYEQLHDHVERGECYVMLGGDEKPCAAMCLGEVDTYVWDAKGEDGTALYFHKLIKDPVTAPAHSGKYLIGFAAQEALRRSRLSLRCDTKPDQKNLVNYYLSLGLKQVGRTTYKSTDQEAILLEALATEVLAKV